VRVYIDLKNEDDKLTQKITGLFKLYPFVDLCNVSRVLENLNLKKTIFPMTWRFLPLMDSMVDIVLPRDSDNVISSRESAAVQQWLSNSDATFHLMRDHIWHCGTKILGGRYFEFKYNKINNYFISFKK